MSKESGVGKETKTVSNPSGDYIGNGVVGWGGAPRQGRLENPDKSGTNLSGKVQYILLQEEEEFKQESFLQGCS